MRIMMPKTLHFMDGGLWVLFQPTEAIALRLEAIALRLVLSALEAFCLCNHPTDRTHEVYFSRSLDRLGPVHEWRSV